MNPDHLPRVTLGLPAFKRTYLKQAIDSILAQTYQDFELIIVNDASPENLDEVINSYVDPRIRYYVNQTNLGRESFVRNWNRCVSLARGELFVIASDDDLYEPTFLERMTALADKYPGVNLFHCRLSVIGKDGEILGSVLPSLEYERCLDFIHNRAVLRRQQVAPDFMCRTSALKAIGGFIDMPIGWYSDDITWFALASQGVGYASDILFRWRVSGLNVSSKNSYATKKMQAAFDFLQRLMPLVLPLTPSSAFEQFQKDDILRTTPKTVYLQIIDDITPAPWKEFLTLFIRLSGNKDYPKRYLFQLCTRKIRFEIRRIVGIWSHAKQREV